MIPTAQVQVQPSRLGPEQTLTGMMLDRLAPLQLSATNPWPGLLAYDESSTPFFHGRNREAAELLRLVELAPLTVVYGHSGLGKSSLLQAGLMPRLRKAHLLPVYLHLDFSATATEAPLAQAMRRLEEELQAAAAEFTPRGEGEDLWRYLHRSDLEFWSADNFPLTPVLILDQFEEIFTRSPDDQAREAALFVLADLIENRIPGELADSGSSAQGPRYDWFAQRYRVVLSFREDFLPAFEAWTDQVPTLLRNRLRLLPLNRAQAVEAVSEPGAAVLAPGVAERIVDFVAHSSGSRGSSAEVEPVLLSLTCSRLNRRRAEGRPIDAALLVEAGEDILDEFYAEALAGMRPQVHGFIEEHLVQGDYRGSYPRDAALAEGRLTADELERLGRLHRLLRVEQRSDTARIELVHDRLVAVVQKARRAREAHAQEQLRQQAVEEVERERERREAVERDRARLKRFRNALAGVLVVTVGTLLGTIWFAVEAQSQARVALVLRLVAEGPAMLTGLRAGGDERALQQLAAVDALAPGSPDVEAAMWHAVKVTDRTMWLVDTGDALASVAFSPDGTRIVSGSRQGTLRVWDAKSGQPIGAALKGHNSSVSSIAFGPDGTRVVSASDDGTLRLWDAKNGQPIGAALENHKGSVLGVAFSPDGTRIVSASSDGTLQLWDAKSGQPIGATLAGYKGWVFSVAFSPDGTRVVSASGDGTLRLWDAKSGQPIGAALEGQTGSALSVAFSPDGTRIVSASSDGTLQLWDAKSGQPIGAALEGHKGWVLSVAFSPDGTRVVSASGDGTLRLWDAKSGQPIGAALEGHKGPVLSVAFSPDGTRVVSGSLDGTVRLWGAKSGQPIGAALEGHTRSVWSIAFSPDSTRVFSGSLDGTLRLWDAKSGQPIGAALKGHTSSVSSVALSSDGTRIVWGSYDGTLRLWDARSGQPIGAALKGHQGMVTSVAFSPDGTRVVSGGVDGTLRLWNAESGEALESHEVQLGRMVVPQVSSVAFSPDGTRIVSAINDGTLRLWDAKSGQPIGAALEGHMGVFAFSPDSTRVVSASEDGTLRLWNAKSGQSIGAALKGHKSSVSSVAFSPNGTRIVSASDDGTLRLWDARSGHPIGVALEGHHMGSVSSVAFSPNGTRIVSASEDGTLRLWDAKSGQRIGAALKGHESSVWRVAFSPDGTRIVSASDDGTLRLWPAPADWPRIVCSRLTRNMSSAQWREWVSPKIDYVVQCPELPVPQ